METENKPELACMLENCRDMILLRWRMREIGNAYRDAYEQITPFVHDLGRFCDSKPLLPSTPDPIMKLMRKDIIDMMHCNKEINSTLGSLVAKIDDYNRQPKPTEKGKPE